MRIKFFGIVILALAFLTMNISSRVHADENVSKERTIRVTGEGKVTAIPDQAEMEFEVSEEGPKLEQVTAQVREKMKNVFKVIKTFGISDKDFQTVSYNIQPKYKYDKNGNETTRVGYIVSNRVHVVLKDVDSAGKLLEAVTGADVSRVEGPFFGFSDPKKLQIEALKAAVEDAHSKAEALAQSSGAELGKVFSINQTNAEMPIERLTFGKYLANAEAPTVPVAKGQNEVTAQVEVVYALK